MQAVTIQERKLETLSGHLHVRKMRCGKNKCVADVRVNYEHFVSNRANDLQIQSQGKQKNTCHY